jgi:hypothetical protein
VTLRNRLIFPAVSLLALASLVHVVQRRRALGVHGSNTNANPFVDLPFIPADASQEEVLDVAVEYTFPASDPIAIEVAYRNRASNP